MAKEQKNRIANSTSWKHTSITAPHEVKFELTFSQEQFDKIKAGFIPEAMEDKWFAFYEDGHLRFYRSWTGYGIYDVLIAEQDGKFMVSHFVVERNADLFKCTDDEEDKRSLGFLIYGLILGEPFPLGIKTGTDAIKAWSSFGRAILTPEEGNDISAKLDDAIKTGGAKQDEQKYYYLTVKFDEHKFLTKKYNYISDDTTVKKGDIVLVDVNGTTTLEAEVIDARFYTKEKAPYPVHLTKKIIAKKETPAEERDEDEAEVEGIVFAYAVRGCWGVKGAPCGDYAIELYDDGLLVKKTYRLFEEKPRTRTEERIEDSIIGEVRAAIESKAVELLRILRNPHNGSCDGAFHHFNFMGKRITALNPSTAAVDENEVLICVLRDKILGLLNVGKQDDDDDWDMDFTTGNDDYF